MAENKPIIALINILFITNPDGKLCFEIPNVNTRVKFSVLNFHL